jgi:site-specific DNA recombinase
MKTAALYMRVSSDKQREKSTIQSQKDLLPKLARDGGYTIFKQYVDDGISGETIEARPAFSQLLLDAEQKKFQAVFVVDFDRLSRASDLAQVSYIKAVLRNNGIVLVTPFQTYNFDNQDEDFMTDIFSVMAKMEKLKIRSRTKRGREAKWKKGQHAHAVIPFGFSWDGKQWGHNKEEADIVRLIYKLALQGLGSRAICVQLNSLGVPTPTDLRGYIRNRKGDKWASTTVKRILSLSTYTGLMVRAQTHVVMGKVVKRNKSEWINIEVPPIVTKEQYEKVREHAKRNQTFSHESKRPYLLSRMLRCGECGSGIVAESVHGRGYYICTSRRKRKIQTTVCKLPWQNQKNLDQDVWELVEKILTDPVFLAKKVELRFKTRLKDAFTGLTRKNLEDLLQRKTAERERVLRLYRKARITGEQLDAQYDEIEKEEAILKRNLDLIDNKDKIQRSMNRELENIEEAVRAISKRVKNFTFEQKQMVIRLLTFRKKPGIVVFDGNKVELEGLFDLENVGLITPALRAMVG